MQNKSLHLDVNEQIECAHTLASRFYTDPSILEIEKNKIFRSTWQLAGTLQHACGEVNGVKRTIADPETFFTAEVAGEPIVVVRDKQGTLRAFSNVCRHRAGPVAQGSGCKNVLRCGYHGWTYTLDGRLIGTPDVEGVEFFDRNTMGMVPLRLETWEQFIFVNFDCKAEPLPSFLGAIPAQTHGFQFAGLRSVERRDYVLECNWKVYVDNYLEGYHIPIAHPGLFKELDYDAYRVETFRYYSKQHAPIRELKPGEEIGRDRRYLRQPGTESDALYYWVFPNVMFNIYQDNMSSNLILPLGVDKTLTVFEWFFAQPGTGPGWESMQQTIAFSDEIQQEDIALCQQVQRGLKSRSYDRGRFNAKRENGVYHFQRLVSEFLS